MRHAFHHRICAAVLHVHIQPYSLTRFSQHFCNNLRLVAGSALRVAKKKIPDTGLVHRISLRAARTPCTFVHNLTNHRISLPLVPAIHNGIYMQQIYPTCAFVLRLREVIVKKSSHAAIVFEDGDYVLALVQRFSSFQLNKLSVEAGAIAASSRILLSDPGVATMNTLTWA